MSTENVNNEEVTTSTETMTEETVNESTTTETVEENTSSTENTNEESATETTNIKEGEETIEKVEGEEVPKEEGNMDAASMLGGLGSLLGAAAGGGAGNANYADVFKVQSTLFERFGDNIDTLMKENDNIKASLTATKMYIKILSKAIIISDAIFIGIILLILLLK